MLLEPLEKEFQAAKYVYKTFFAVANTLNRLKYGGDSVTGAHTPSKKDAHLEKDPDARENRVCRWECL
jgi:hypothetical protein